MAILVNGKKPYNGKPSKKKQVVRIDNRTRKEKMLDAMRQFQRNLTTINGTTLKEDGSDLRLYGVIHTDHGEFMATTNRPNNASDEEIKRIARGTSCVCVRKQNDTLFFRFDDIKERE